MEYFKTTKNNYIEYDLDTGKLSVFTKQSVQDEVKQIEDEISKLEKAKTDIELLQWAKENYLIFRSPND